MKTMKAQKLGIIGAAALFLASAVHTFGIEGLKLTVHCPDVWLSWPSVEDDNYIVQWREDLSTNSNWVTLTNALPAYSGTNLTIFVHSNRVDCPTGQIFGMMMSGGGSGDSSLGNEGKKEEYKPSWPTVIPKDGSRVPVPLGIYPPGIDLSGYTIIWPDGSTDAWSKELVEKWRAQEEEQPGPQPEDAGGGGPGTGFYRVVRVGVNWFGITNGTVLSGKVILPLEFGNSDTNRLLSVLFLTDTNDDGNVEGSVFPNFPDEATTSLSGVWDTTQVTNGSYTLIVGARLTDEAVYLDHPVTVTVSNVIWFPDSWDVGGLGIYIGAQTIFTNGVWHLDVYDDQNNYLGFLDGPIASDGYCAYPGIPGPGFTLDNTDAFGNQNPSTAYTMVMSAGPTNAPPPYPMATNKVFIESAWNFGTYAVTCHMNPFASWKPGWDDVHQLMTTIWNVEQPFHPNLLGGFTTPYEVFTLNDWSNVVVNLLNPYCRDFFYFGHGSETSLGPNTNVDLRVSDIKIFLKNNLDDPLTATNRQPYRFVFLDGCNTADGNWPQAFGIPKKEGMVITDFTEKRGIRPRAFMGWNRKKVFSSVLGGSQLYPPHETYITTFWEKWAERDGQGGPLRNLTDAISIAKSNAPNAALGMKVYGAKNLVIDY